MIPLFRRLVLSIGRSIERHGGGLAGTYAVTRRALQMAGAIGVRGFMARLRQAAHPPPSPPPLVVAHRFAAPAPLEQVRLKVGVMLHAFYPDLLDEFADLLAAMPVPFTLLVSVTDPDTVAEVESRFGATSGIERLLIEVVANRGRDIAPFVSTFRDDIIQLDIVAHLHTKKSLYTGSSQNAWRRYLTHALLGTRERIAWQLGMFVSEPRLGLVYPDSYESVPLWAHTWLSNLDAARALGARLGIGVHAGAYLDFPAGSMFWARVDAIRPLLDLRLATDDFPEERGQVDGTLQHAIERLLVPSARASGHLVGILPRDGTLALTSEGDRNWSEYFALPLRDRLPIAALDAQLISSDVFDTLVVRPFLSPEAARACLGRLVEKTFDLADFVSLRERAEERARVAGDGHDPCLQAIYRSMAELLPRNAPSIDALRALEESSEAKWLRPREGVLAAVQLAARGRRLVALSDMYLDTATLKRILPPAVAGLPSAWYVSCETGWRKDTGSAWAAVPEVERVPAGHWLHIGDNEQADIQVPQWHGLLTPAHVLRPAAMLDVVPGLRALRGAVTDPTDWQNALWLGLVANHFADLADRDPSQLAPRVVLSPHSLGYCMLGPLVLDYLVWLLGTARARGARRILFLSREGHLLKRGFDRLSDAVGSDRITGHYFLASRQAAGLAAPHHVEDLRSLFSGTYNGTLDGLLRARLGSAATAAITPLVEHATLSRQVFLPEMGDAIVDMLEPAHDRVLQLAASARAAYRLYWQSLAGDDPVLLADIGYSGTIQRHLARMLGRPLDGAYFALNAGALAYGDAGWMTARFHDGRTDGAESAQVLRHDLLLESLLTAPDPQFAGFGSENGQPVPRYADADVSAPQWSLITQVHDGAIRFIEDICSAAGPLADELVFDATAIQKPLACVGDGSWSAPWLQALGIADTYTGRGAVPALAGTAPPAAWKGGQ
ncbi:rhamnan synthesis F family protein [Luteimonas abyssi]|uniref:rhamnan synthesis F family protein n=1 Tax=Luteimonas abyssi TaxID=1247514 RepID=UPI000737D313|nr:rhamnan synthesis F family protein [Luteimonas abyssi]